MPGEEAIFVPQKIQRKNKQLKNTPSPICPDFCIARKNPDKPDKNQPK